jgi:hypothetical protein
MALWPKCESVSTQITISAFVNGSAKFKAEDFPPRAGRVSTRTRSCVSANWRAIRDMPSLEPSSTTMISSRG